MKIFIVVILLVIIILIMQRYKKKSEIIKTVPHKGIVQEQIDTTIDLPVGFGYKIMWFAVKSNDPNKLAEIMGIKIIQKANWKTGIDYAYERGVFITPNIDNWIIVVGCNLPHGDSKKSIENVKSILMKLSQEFGDAQFFCTHRVVELHTWVKSTKGQIDRVYSYVGEGGENIVVEGIPTAIEKPLFLINTLLPESKQAGYYERDDLVYPDEKLVMKIAENWSINPSVLDNRMDIKGLGIIGNCQSN